MSHHIYINFDLKVDKLSLKMNIFIADHHDLCTFSFKRTFSLCFQLPIQFVNNNNIKTFYFGWTEAK